MQIMASQSEYGQVEQFQEHMEHVKRGDVVGVQGVAGRSRLGELSIVPQAVYLLAPCLHTLSQEGTVPEDHRPQQQSTFQDHVCFLLDARILPPPFCLGSYVGRVGSLVDTHVIVSVLGGGGKLQDIRYRQRYLDMLVHPYVVSVFHKRAKVHESIHCPFFCLWPGKGVPCVFYLSCISLHVRVWV